MSKSNLDLSLDEIAQKENSRVRVDTDRRGGRGSGGRRGGGRLGGRRREYDGGGVMRRLPRSVRKDIPPFSRSRAPDDKWGHDGFEQLHGGMVAAPHKSISQNFISGFQWGTKISIRDLRYDVLEDDLRDLMETVGVVEHLKIFYDSRSGRSQGKAEVVFRSRYDAESAVKEYDGIAIDDQPMHIELIGKVKIPSKGDPWRDRGVLRNRFDRDGRSKDLWRPRDDRLRDDRPRDDNVRPDDKPREDHPRDDDRGGRSRVDGSPKENGLAREDGFRDDQKYSRVKERSWTRDDKNRDYKGREEQTREEKGGTVKVDNTNERMMQVDENQNYIITVKN